MVVCTLASGSDGNAVLIGHEGTYILVDAGISARRIDKALWGLGLSVSDIARVLVTHEHGDHICGLPVLRRDILAAPLTAAAIRGKAPHLLVEEITSVFRVGSLEVTPFATPHDTPDSLGFLIDAEGFRVCVCTDLGHITPSVLEHICRAHCLLIESNHDPAMLKNGRYPEPLKRRVAGPHGHLSNDTAAQTVLTAVKNGTRYITLCHLSKENNKPELAEGTVSRLLERNGVSVGQDVFLSVAPHGVAGTPLYL